MYIAIKPEHSEELSKHIIECKDIMEGMRVDLQNNGLATDELLKVVNGLVRSSINHVHRINGLRPLPPLELKISKEDIARYKRYGVLEKQYFIHTNKKIEINNESEYEGTTHELSKLRNEGK